MKTIKTLFAILFLSTMFIACETDSVEDEVGLNEGIEDVFGLEEASESVEVEDEDRNNS